VVETTTPGLVFRRSQIVLRPQAVDLRLMASPFGSMLKLALSPSGRRTIRRVVRLAQSEEGRKLIAQARKVATGPEGRKLIQQATLVAKSTRRPRKGK
jgi:hypothetical protein